MCGIAGFLDETGTYSCDEMHHIVRTMAMTLYHRGPDDAGEWVDERAGIALGFRRLSILDLSPAGHQPMPSASGRYMLAFNGEVYNFSEIRKELEAQGRAPDFRGDSDTEVMLAAFEAWGLEAAVNRFVGMFAFALWDRKERILHLVRDRVGIKPMYYGWCGETFLFGSELKALRAHPAFKADIDRDALALMMRYDYVPSPYSIYGGIYKLPPGTMLSLKTEGSARPEPRTYWSVREAVERGIANPFSGTEAEAVAQLEALLLDSVALRMISDVPLGVFLSGGVDSSLVTALMQAQSRGPVKTFTIGFNEHNYNEAHYASAISRHLKTYHTELTLAPEDALSVIPKLPSLYDEPFADVSQIPTYLVSELARRHVTVSLSGDGGDELFAGYTRHLWGRRLWSKLGWLPARMRRIAAAALMSCPPQTWDQLFRKAGTFLPAQARQRNPGDKLAKLAEIMRCNSPEAMYSIIVSNWKDPSALVLDACEPPLQVTSPTQWPHLDDVTQRMLYLDTVSYLPDDILVKVDRASMGVSLEARDPLMDHRILEFAWSLPLSMKLREGQGKWLLRQVLYKYVPKRLIERPKAGLEVPIHLWLRGPLRDWAEALLDEKTLKQQGFFNAAMIRACWQEHLSGRQNRHEQLWNVLMFQAWISNSR